ncbi:MAG: DUF4037 domain-containing protein [Armatimonadetes bacterium]|nr:DUF4037 domain-containing protein [Armatimonadota bacterium]
MIPDHPFLPGLALSERFYVEAVRPILDSRYPGLTHSAARLDFGSDVLGFDTPQSMDHGWGPRLSLFLSEKDRERFGEEIPQVLSDHLPFEVAGIPTHFRSPDLSQSDLERIDSGPVRHGVQVLTLREFAQGYLSLDPEGEVGVLDWLVMPEQRLRTIQSGRVFHDGLATLEPFREKLRYYPRDVWLYRLASQWQKINQEEPFVGRCGDVGDDLGSRVLAARLIHELMRLCFLMERTYAPYSKWFGTAFSRLKGAGRLTPAFRGALSAADWKERERHLSEAYRIVAEMHNDLGVTAPLSTELVSFYDRPYQVLFSGRFAEALRDVIRDEEVLRLPPYLGSIDQITDMVDVLERNEIFTRFKGVYQGE